MRLNSLKTTFYSNVTFLFLMKLLVGCVHMRGLNSLGDRMLLEKWELRIEKTGHWQMSCLGTENKSNFRWHPGEGRGNPLIIIDYMGKH